MKFTWQELYRLRNWEMGAAPMHDGHDPYNSADHMWNRWLLALSLRLL
jgi:hypothetical protein